MSAHTLTTALSLIARGFKIFPCIPGTKRPLTAHGFLDATADPVQIDRWFRYGDKNIGLATGNSSQVVAIDFDAYKNVAEANLLQLQQAYGPLPETYTVNTPRGGRHLYFRLPAGYDLRSYNNVLAQGVDLRANGGYILTEGSHCVADKYSGEGDYTVASDMPIADLPVAWAEAWQALNARQDELAAKKAAKLQQQKKEAV